MRKGISLIISALFILTPAPLIAAVMDTSFTYSTLRTAHFNIHYHQGLEETAARTAAIAEEVSGRMEAFFQWTPEEKTEVVLIDNSDFPNGYSYQIPYNTVYLFTVPPAIETTIGEYDDWLKTLFVHEYAHILTLDPARGYSKLTRKIFGKTLPTENLYALLAFLMTAPPNTFLPRWWHEGMATMAESEFAGGGRGRSSYYDMIYRMAAAEDDIPTIDKLNGDVPDWPAGSTPYLFGLAFQRYLAERFGKETPGDMNLMHAGFAPYFLNDPARRLFDNINYITLYNDMTAELRRKQEVRMARLSAHPFTEVKVIAADGEFLTRPRFSPDGSRIAFTREDPHGHTTIMVMNRDGSGMKEAVRRTHSDGAITWSPDGKKLYFSQSGVYRGYNIYQDLYAFDLEAKRLERLTKGARLGEPDLSPDGTRIAAVANSRGSQNLVLVELKEGKAGAPKTVTSHALARAASPRWSSDGESILYVLKENGGPSSLRRYHPGTGTEDIVLQGEENIGWPVWLKGGKEILYVSDRSGVYNLYRLSIPGGKSRPATHLLSGAFFPDAAPGGGETVFSLYGANGMNIASVQLAEEKGDDAPLPDIRLPAREEPASNSGGSAPETAAPTPYSPFGTLAPRFWLPTLIYDNEGSAPGLFTAGQDVLGYHTWFIEGTYGRASHEGYYRAAYLNNRYYPALALEAYAQPLLYTDFPEGYAFYEKEESVSLSAKVPVNGIESGFAFTFGHEWRRKRALSDLSGGYYLTMPVFEGRLNNLFGEVEYSNALKYPHSISAEEGRTLSLMHRHYSKNAGSDISSREWYLSWSEHLRAPFTEKRSHQVVYLNLKGAVSDGDRIGQQAFQLGGTSDISAFPLRGYPARFALGTYIATGTIEYRAPIATLMKGWNSKPFFYRKLHGALFVDSGAVWDEGESFHSNMLKTGAGVELRLDMTLGYYLKVTPTIGLAHGFDPGGETRGYFTVYVEL